MITFAWLLAVFARIQSQMKFFLCIFIFKQAFKLCRWDWEENTVQSLFILVN